MKAFITQGNAALKKQGHTKTPATTIGSAGVDRQNQSRKLETCSYAKAFYGHRENSGGCGQATAGINSV